MKAILVIWAGRPSNLPSWFENGKEKETSWDDIQELYNSGANVMLIHNFDKTKESHHDIMIGVDTQGFQQR